MIYTGPGVIHSKETDEKGVPTVIKNGDVIIKNDVDEATWKWLKKQDRLDEESSKDRKKREDAEFKKLEEKEAAEKAGK